MNSLNIDRSKMAIGLRTTALLASLSFSLLAGCGGGGGGGSSSSSPYSNRSYSTESLPLGTGQTGTLTISVGSDATTIAGTLQLVIVGSGTSTESRHAATRQSSVGTPASVALTGDFNASTGAFNLTGITTLNNTTYTVTAVGTLAKSGTTGGTTTITINGSSFTGSFGAGTLVSGQLSSSYFPITTSNANLVYQDTFTDSSGGTPSVSTETGYSFLGGFGTILGATTQTQLNGKTVNKIEELDSTGAVTGYDYYTLTSSALTIYGGDGVSAGVLDSSFRISPAFVIPLNLSAGQTSKQTVTITETGTSTTSSSYSYTAAESLMFNDIESVTVPAGTYPTAAKFTESITETEAATATEGASTYTSINTFYLAPNVGVVQENETDTSAIAATSTTPASTDNSTDNTVLTSTTGASGESKSVSPRTRQKAAFGAARLLNLFRQSKTR